MPLHDWTRVPAGIFHDFHQTWTIHLRRHLNFGILPAGLTALVEQRAGFKLPDEVAIEHLDAPQPDGNQSGGLLIAEQPKTRHAFRTSNQIYAARANRIVVKHHLGKTIAVIEIMSPGNKDSRAAIREFVDKTIDCLRAGVHVLVIDLFPPTPRDPNGIHELIWSQFADDLFSIPVPHDRVAASYEAGYENAAFVETFAVGQPLPEMPLYLAEGKHVAVPLELSYQSAWDDCPMIIHDVVMYGNAPT